MHGFEIKRLHGIVPANPIDERARYTPEDLFHLVELSSENLEVAPPRKRLALDQAEAADLVRDDLASLRSNPRYVEIVQ